MGSAELHVLGGALLQTFSEDLLGRPVRRDWPRPQRKPVEVVGCGGPAVTLASQAWWDEASDAEAGSDLRWERAFEQAWPVVARRLRAVLRARKVPQSDWDDYLQEVAARMITARLAFDRPEEVVPWATTVVRRLHLDHVRRAERLRRIEGRMATTARRTPDVASSVIAKLDLDRVAKEVGTWSAFDRDALLVGEGEGANHTRGSGASYVRRHRLRASLLRVIDGMGAAVAGVRRFHVRRAGEAHQLASIVASPVALACAALVLPFVMGPDAPATSRPAPAAALATAASDRAAGLEGGPAAAGPARSPLTDATPPRAATAAVVVPVRPDQPMRLPVEYKVTIEGGGHSGYVELENNHGPEPLWCSSGVPGIPDHCVDPPLPRVDVPVEEPW